MTEICDLCHSSAMEPSYEPTASRRGLTVYLCSDCGLVQSLPRRVAAAPSVTDRRNIRSGKALRAEAFLSLIHAHADLSSSPRVLGIGSDRGPFARALHAAAPEAFLTCIEPEEDIHLPDARFDIVHSCRMIDQVASPSSTLADLWHALKPGGLLIIDAPNIALIDGDDIVGEWFIDNHLYHFSQRTLARLLEVAGFEIVSRPDPKDRENLLFAARKRKQPTRSASRDPAEVDAALALITSYVTARARAQRAA